MSQYTETVASLRARIERGDAVTEVEIEALRGLTNLAEVEEVIANLKRLLRERAA